MKLFVKENDRKPIPKKPQQEDEETLTYMKRPKPIGNLNRDKGIFDQKKFEGINTRENIFDAQAVFRTDNRE